MKNVGLNAFCYLSSWVACWNSPICVSKLVFVVIQASTLKMNGLHRNEGTNTNFSTETHVPTPLTKCWAVARDILGSLTPVVTGFTVFWLRGGRLFRGGRALVQGNTVYIKTYNEIFI